MSGSSEKKQHGRAPERLVKSIFVIMPFTRTPSRKMGQLTTFFKDHIQAPIERARFKHKYRVRRSDDTFNITENIIKELYVADIVVCDLSGTHSNPNVMYELGIRLAISEKPVILIREAHKDNKAIFDIGGFYAEPYDPFQYRKITEYIKDKVRKLETDEEQYSSPILQIIAQEQPLIATLSSHRAVELLRVMQSSIVRILDVFGLALRYYVDASPIKECHGKLECEKSWDLVIRLAEYRADFEKVDWRGFSFRLGSQACIDSYLASPFLVGLVNVTLAEEFTEALIHYHVLFLSTSVVWDNPSYRMVLIFAGECWSMLVITNELIGVLQSSSSKEREEHVREAKKHMAFKESVMAGIDLKIKDGRELPRKKKDG